MGIFFENAIGFLTAFNPPNLPPGGRFALSGDASGFQRRRVRGAKVPGLMNDVDLPKILMNI